MGGIKERSRLSKYLTFVQRLHDLAAKQPDKTAFTFLQDGETELDSLTYFQLDERARAIAAILQGYHAEGERALLLYQPGLEFITAFLGCLYAGVIAVPAYPPRANRSISRLLTIVADAQAKFALTTQSLQDKIESKFIENAATGNSVRFISTDTLNVRLSADWHQPHLTPDTLAFLQYTSGSTGTPKGVMVSHANILANSISINRCFRDTPESKGVSWLPPYHDMGLIGGILQPLYLGAFMALMSPVTFLQRPYYWLKAISTYQASTSGGPNFAYDLCVNQITPEQRDTLDLSCWELAFTGAEPVRAETIEKFTEYFRPCGFRKTAFYPCYGMAESTLLITGGAKDAEPVLKSFDKLALENHRAIAPTEVATATNLVGCGQNVEGQTIIIANPETLTQCRDGEIGEIWVTSASVARGYWNRKEQTEETFNAYLADTGEGPFVRTGDLGFLEDGELFVTGRLKDLIIIRGRNHYPQDLELTVDNSHPAIRPASGAAFAVEVEGEEKLVIVQEIQRSYLRKLNAEEVIGAIRKAIRQQHEIQPYAVVLLKTGSVPKTSSGKIQRHACKKRFLNDSLEKVSEWRSANVGTKKQEAQNGGVRNFSNVILEEQLNKQSPLLINHRSPNNQPKNIQAWIVDNLALRLGISPQSIDAEEPFVNYGLDSVQAVRLSTELEDWLGVKLSPTLAYDYPTIASLASYLAQLRNQEKHSLSTIPHSPFPIPHSPIAIVGMGCRFPGANNPQAFWQLLREGKDAITKVKGRWQGEDWGGFIEDIDQFDPQFFGISPRETQQMDPQQRLLLEVSWEALEQAGMSPDSLAGSLTGVFVGISSSDYSQLQVSSGTEINAYAGTGNAHSIAANRLSYVLDLRGPSLAVDTACSSSLVAVHLACQSLKRGECDRAIAAGVNLMLSPELTRTFSLAGMMAADGRCKTFDASADGYVRGEGCGVVILKRVEDAIRDGDNILAIIKGSAINQDGKSNGLTAPNGLAQQAVINQALAEAGIQPSAISYVETHGTGTSLGDPIEVNSLKTLLMEGRKQEDYCYLGSVKTNIGHLEAAAGIAGLIKTVLCLQNEEIPANLHLNQLNPHIDIENTPISIPRQLQPWQRGEQPRLAGVSSFGFGGTNAHIILQEAGVRNQEPGVRSAEGTGQRTAGTAPLRGASFRLPPGQESEFKNKSTFIELSSTDNQDLKQFSQNVHKLSTDRERPLHLLTLSAKNEEALRCLVKRYQDYLASHPQVSIADVCFTANTGRSHFDHRLAVVAQSREDFIAKLASSEENKQPGGLYRGQITKSKQQKIAFLFTGQGSQYVGMGYQLYQTQPTFRQAIDRCAEILQFYLDKPLLEVLYPTAAEKANSLLDQTAYTQPAIFAVEYALAQLWLSWGIVPDAVMGHSIGEYVAATVAGVFSLEDGLKLIAYRGKLMQSLPQNGEMIAVFASENIVQAAIQAYQERVTIAAINSPQNIVISGEKEALERVINKLAVQGINYKKLNVSHAFHSPLMEPILAEFEQIASSINYGYPQISFISNVTGKLVETESSNDRYWVKHILEPVRFASSIEWLQQQEYDIFIEIGAKPILLGMGRQCCSEAEALWLPSLRPRKEDWQQISQSLATLYVRGIKINWAGFDRDYQRQKLSLPTYPFQRQRYWLENISTSKIKNNRELKQTGTSSIKKIAKTDFYQIEWQLFSGKILNSNKQTNAWLIFGSSDKLNDLIIQELERQEQDYQVIYSGDDYQYFDDNSWSINPRKIEHFQKILANNKDKLGKIIYLWSLNNLSTSELTTEESEINRQKNLSGLLYLIQALYEQSLNVPIWIVTRGTQEIDSQIPEGAIASSMYWGLGKVIASEHPEYWGGAIDLAPIPEADEAKHLIAAINNKISKEDHLAIRQDRTYVARLNKFNLELKERELELSRQHSYLITGGLGSLGLKLAQWLVEKGANNLVLVGRNKPSAIAREKIAQLEAKGVKVLITQTDASDRQAIAEVLDKCQRSLPPLKGIIHAAGVLDDGFLQSQTEEKFERVISPKLMGAWHLHQLTQEMPLDFFIMFSSVASLMGSPGQGNYAAANASLDAIARYRKSRGLPAISINWGPWAETGMAATKGFERKGISLIPPERGFAALEQLLVNDSTQAQLGVIAADWKELSKQFPYLHQSNYFSQLLNPSASKEKQKSNIYTELLAISVPEREKYLTDYLQRAIAQILQIDKDKLSVTESLLDSGMDSLMVMEAVNQLKDDLQLMLYPREFYERPKIDSLAKYLATEFTKTHDKSVFSSSNKLEIKAQQTTSFSQRHRVSPSPPLPVSPSPRLKLPPAVFILSSPRSGSTLLRVMLAGHPALSSPPELHLLPFKTMGEREKEIGISHLGKGLQRAFMEFKNIDARESQQLIDNLVKENLSIEEVYRLLQQLSGDRLLVDKSPTYASSRETLERAEALFDKPKYIHLVRHPYAVIESFVRMRMDKLIGSTEANPYQLAESIWTTSNQNILDLAAEIDSDRHHLVKYEELVSDPQGVMEEICEFLGISFDSAVLAPYQGERMTDGVYHTSMSLGDPNFLNHRQIDAQLAETWRTIKLPLLLNLDTQTVARHLNYELPQEAESPALSMQETLIDIRGLRLCLCSWGPEEGPLVLCLHGILEQGAAWSEVAIRLAQRGYRVIAPDLRGHGRSDRLGKGGSYNLLDFLADLDAIAENLADKAFTLVGHSLGSVVAAIFASIRPQRIKNLVLVETILPTDVEDEEAANQLATHLDYLANPPKHPVFSDVEAAAERLRQGTPGISKPLAMLLAERITEPCEGGVRWRWAPILRTRAGVGFNGIGRSRYLGLLKRIKVPITLVYGDKSSFNRQEDLAAQQAAMPHAEKVVVSGGHNLPLETPSPLAKIISGAIALTNKLIS